MGTTEVLFAVGGTMISLLLAGNIFFIKRLIDRIDSTGEKASAALRGVEDQARTLIEIKTEIKEMRRLEIDVAVLKSFLNMKVGQRNMGSDKVSNAS